MACSQRSADCQHAPARLCLSTRARSLSRPPPPTTTTTYVTAGDRPSEATLDARQLSFVGELVTALRAAHYAPLSSSQWEAASSEDFMVSRA